LLLHGCTPFDGEPVILTPVMKASVEFKGVAPDFCMPTQKQVFLLKIASGMELIRANRFIRRGLKPANILLDHTCEPRIGDFGLLKFIERVATLSRSMQAGAPVHGVGDL
jgi:hypothetical protein